MKVASKVENLTSLRQERESPKLQHEGSRNKEASILELRTVNLEILFSGKKRAY